jgi:non-homologous end joining protein Ku
MRANRKGSINFGLVYIPVSVYPATREEKISSKQLRATDLSSIRHKKVVKSDQRAASRMWPFPAANTWPR